MEYLKPPPVLVHRYVPWSVVGPVVDPDPTPWLDVSIGQHVQQRG